MTNKIKNAFINFGHHLIEARQDSVNRKIARMQLFGMTDRELKDIGLTRSDISRVTR